MLQAIDLEKFAPLIGKNLSASGWHYDSGGTAIGKIISIEPDRYTMNKVIVKIEPKSERSMKSFSFYLNEMEILLKEGKLPQANTFLSAGVNASID